MKKIVALLLAVLMLLTVVSSLADDNEYEETVVISLGGMLDTPDPYGSTGAECQMMTNMTHSMLTYNNSDNGTLDGILVESWEDVNGDGKSWKINLKQGVKFHNLEELTAEDVKFTWEYASADAGNVIKPLSQATYVESMDIVDNYTLVFNLKSAMFDFPTYLDTKIYCKKAFETMEAAEAAKIGTGPYMYDETLYKPGVQYGFSRFDDYYEGIDNYHTKHFVIRNILEEDARVAALQAGEIDYCWLDTSTLVNILQNDPNVTLHSRSGAQSYYLGWNWFSESCDVNDIKFRTAIAKAISKDDIIAIAFENGLGGTASYNFCAPSGLGYVEVDAIEYDPEGAIALLQELGIPNGYKMTLVHYPSTKKIAEVIQADLAYVGIDLTITQVDGTNWSAIKAAHENFDVFLDYCSYKGALLYNYNRFFAEGGSSNVTGYHNEEFQTLLQNVLNAPNYDEMLKEFAVMQQWVATDVSVYPIAYNNMFMATLNDVQGVVLADTANWMNFSTIYIEKR